MHGNKLPLGSICPNGLEAMCTCMHTHPQYTYIYIQHMHTQTKHTLLPHFRCVCTCTHHLHSALSAKYLSRKVKLMRIPHMKKLERCFDRTFPLLRVFSPKYIITEKSPRGVLLHVTFFFFCLLALTQHVDPDCTMKSLLHVKQFFFFFFLPCVCECRCS